MALREYLTTEVGEDWVDGLITRREAVRRLILLGMTASSASALLAACAARDLTQSCGITSGRRRRRRRAGASASAAASGSPATSTPGEAITFPGPRGELQGFLAAGRRPRPGRCS